MSVYATPSLAQTAAAGTTHSLVVKSDGTVWSFGANGNGQLGDGTTTNRAIPVQVSGLSDVVAVAAGGQHSMAITSTGALYVWGYNNTGQVGDGTTTARNAPVQLSLTNVVAIAAGEGHSVAMRSNGDTYTWGNNANGQLGNGSTTNTNSPALVVTGGAAVAAGYWHTIFVKSNGTVYAAGANGYGQLGDASTTQRTSPVQMSGISTATGAAAGKQHSLIVLGNGTVKGAGYNNSGQLGDGSGTSQSSPISITNLTGVVAVAAGQWHSLFLKSDGSVRTAGYNLYGQLGDGSGTTQYSHVAVSALSSIDAVAAGGDHSLAVSSTGVVYTWGRNDNQQLGDGSTSGKTTPNAISDVNFDWRVTLPTISVAAGTYHTNQTATIAVATAGATIHYTQNGNDPTTSDATIASGSSLTISTSHTLKVKAFKTGMTSSNVASAAYVMQVGAISYSPAPSTYTSAQNVTLSTATPGTTIRYTTDGSTPTTASAAYTGAINISTSTVLKAIGFKSAWNDSVVRSDTYTMNFGTLSTPTADQATGEYVDNVTVTLSAVSGATVRYTVDNTAVDATSPSYGAPVSFGITTVLRFKAFHADYSPSAEVARTYTLRPTAPSFSPTAGSYVAGQLVTITAPTSGSSIHYSINGAEPTESDPSIASGSTLVVGNYTLKAKAWKSGTSASATTTATYSISGDVTPPALAVSETHSLALRNDGTAWSWGENGNGQLGNGTITSSPRLIPGVVSGLTGAVAIAAGGTHSLAITSTGDPLAFGDNSHGRLGDGTTTQRTLPTAVTNLAAVVSIKGGNDFSIALKGDGSVYTWGNNTYGQLGDGTTSAHSAPAALGGLTSVSAISAGTHFGLALKQNGTITSWGRNAAGQLGNASTTDSTSPVTVSTISTATAISAGQLHALALLADGTVRAWGYNFYGQLGDGSTTDRTSPVAVTGLDDVIAIGAGGVFSVALKDDGTVWSWGDNSFGELGDGTTNDRSEPAQVAGLSDIVQIAVGPTHVLAMTSDYSVYAWGRNHRGQLGDGTQTTQLAPVAISGPGMNWRVATPILSLASGVYYADQTVTVTIADPQATLRYTTTGVDPTSSDATVTSGGTIAVQQSQTLKVSGWKTGSPTSVVVARTYELKVTAPSMSPGAGAYGSTQNVAMTTSTPAATIRYTTDGTEPSTASTSYSSAISVADTQTVKARAYKTGWTASDTGYASYSISAGTVATPVITPSGGTQATPPLVAITTSTTGATIRFTVDGSTPTAASAVFAYPFLVPATTTVKAKAFKAGYASSAVASTTYDVDAAGAAATPAIAPAGGWFSTQQTVTITGASGTTLRYTTDGSDPSTSSTPITSGTTITVSKSQVVKVRAWATGLTASAVRRADFVVTGAISAGNSHSVALASNRALWAWGSNATSQLGDPSYQQALTPIQVLTGVTAMSAGATHVIAVKADGSVWAWGNASDGRLGDGNSWGSVGTPTQITFSDAVAVAAGSTHSLVLKSDGTVWAFGRNQYGELGDGTTTQRTSAVQVAGLTGIVAIAAARESSYALQSDGAGGGIVWAWGNNTYGQLGDGSTHARTTPVRVLGIAQATAIAASKLGDFALAIGADGQVYGWGRNNAYQLGLRHAIDQHIATPLPVVSASRLIAVGTDFGLAVDATARSWAWGKADAGALGVGPIYLQQRAIVPQRSDLGGALQVTAGDVHTLALRPNGTVSGLGFNGSGQLGDGTLISSLDSVTASALSLADNTWLAGDQDSDALETWREYLAGTDPLNPDTNGNGILDGHDDLTGVHALDPDSDDDGVPNWIEQKNGTDPFDADTDGDSVNDANDAFPLDPTRSLAPSSNPSDTTPPVVTLKEPVSAQLIP